MLTDAWIADRRPVLVVEDCDDDFDTVLHAAARAGVRNRLVRAVDADAARRLLACDVLACDAAGGFAFVLLDDSLPGVDGLALRDHVRRDGLLAHLPVVVFTTSINPRDRDLFCAAGASAFHVKCVQYTDSLVTLVAIFERWLKRTAPPDCVALCAGRSA